MGVAAQFSEFTLALAPNRPKPTATIADTLSLCRIARAEAGTGRLAPYARHAESKAGATR